MAKAKVCVECGGQLEAGQDACPKCGAEQPAMWMVYLVYALLALFIGGAIYRIIVP